MLRFLSPFVPPRRVAGTSFRLLLLLLVAAGMIVPIVPADDPASSAASQAVEAGEEEEEDKVYPSVIFLLANPRPLTNARLVAAMEKVFGPVPAAPAEASPPADVDTPGTAPDAEDAPASDDAAATAEGADDAGAAPTRFVIGEDAPFIFRVDDWFFIIHADDEPYFPPERLADDDVPPAVAAALRDHTAWRSFDLIDVGPSQTPSSGYRVMAAMQRELAFAERDRVRGIFIPSHQLLITDRDDLDRFFDTPDAGAALDVLFGSTFVGIPADDPEMKAAVDTARRRWPEFVASFDAGREDALHFIKAPIREGDAAEFIWIQVTRIADDAIDGRLANSPRDLPTHKEGDPVSVPLDELNDWMILSDEGMTGAFTVEVIRRKAAAR